MNVLYEAKMDDFVTSGITNKSIHKKGVGRSRLVKAILNYPNSLHILYEVDSSDDDNGAKHFAVNGQSLSFLNKGYASQLHFTDIQNIVPPNFMQLPYSQQEQILQQVFDQAEMKVQCDCGSFYWQGMWEKDAEKDNTYSSFTGQHGKDIWAGRHNASGNVQGQQLCKHLWSVVEQIEEDIPAILKLMGSNTSSASSTVQDDALEAPESPAGVPDERPRSEGGIKSVKAADTISADINEIKSRAEQNDLPTMDLSAVESKPVEGDADVVEGAEDYEPPIEEPNKAENLDADATEDKMLEEPLDTKTKSDIGLVESFERIYQQSLREKKDHIINKLPRLSNTEKEEVINFFKNHSNLENKIDWNNKSLTINDFRQVMKSVETSRSAKKAEVKADLRVAFDDYVKNGEAHVWFANDKLILVSPLSWACAQFMDSYNCYGEGAKWCIGKENDPQHWNDYVCEKRQQFIMLYDAVEKTKFMIERSNEEYYDIWDAKDNHIYAESKGLVDAVEHLIGDRINEFPIQEIEADVNEDIEELFYNCDYEEHVNNREELGEELNEYYIEELLKGRGESELESPINLFPTLMYEIRKRGEGIADEDENELADEVLVSVTNTVIATFHNEVRAGRPVDDEWMVDLYAADKVDVDGEISEKDRETSREAWYDKKRTLLMDKERSYGQQFLFESIYRKSHE